MLASLCSATAGGELNPHFAAFTVKNTHTHGCLPMKITSITITVLVLFDPLCYLPPWLVCHQPHGGVKLKGPDWGLQLVAPCAALCN